jgi:hypothetical protein
MSEKENTELELDNDSIIDSEEPQLEEESIAASTLKAGSRSTDDPKSKVEYMQKTLGIMNGMKKEDLSKWFDQAIALIGKEADSLPSAANAGANQASVDMKTGKGPKIADPMPNLSVKEGVIYENMGDMYHATFTHPKTGKERVSTVFAKDDKDAANQFKKVSELPQYSGHKMEIHPSSKKSRNIYKEDVDEMFAGEELTEEFREKATTLFEAAVNVRLVVEAAKLEEKYETLLEEVIEEHTKETVENLDKYLNYVVESWMKENEVAIESTLRNELAEDFINGLKNLFVEHYIDIPEEKIDVIESLTDKVTSLEEELNNAIEHVAELESNLMEAKKIEIIHELSEDLTLSQVEKFTALAEGITYDDLDVFKRKLSIVKENYFKDSKTHSSNINEETFITESTNEPVNIDPAVNRYVTAISRTIKK